MKSAAIVICALVTAILVAIFIAAWINDIRMQYFRANIKSGQLVAFCRMYYSRTEDESEYGNGIVYSIDDDEVVVIKQDMSKIRLQRNELFPA